MSRSFVPVPGEVRSEGRRHGERLISELSSRLMGLPAAEIDAAITPALREIVQNLGLDRSTLTEFSPDLGRMRFTHSWAVGVAPVMRWISVTEAVPWSLERCKAGLPIVFDHIDDLPQEANVDKEFWRQIGLRSHTTMPLHVAGQLVGGFSMGYVRRTHAWSREELAGARQLADVFAIAVARKHAHDDLQRAMGFERLLADISAALIREPPRDVEVAVRKALRTIGGFLNVDLAALWNLEIPTGRFHLMHSWVAGAPASWATIPSTIELPWLVERITRDEIVCCSALGELPVEADTDKRILEKIGARALLVVPLAVEGGVFGAFSLATTGLPRAWSEELVPRVRLLGETLAVWVARERASVRINQAQAEAALYRERLAHLERVHTVGEMSASIAHEINQPLVAIENYAMAGRRRLGARVLDADKLDELLEKIGAQAARAGAILQRLRAMLKKREPETTAIDLGEVVSATVKLIEMGSRSPKLRVEIDIARDLPQVMADEIQIQQVVLNLLRNAIDAMEIAGTARKVLTIGLRRCADSELLVSVTDTGPGVAPGDAQRIFEAFYSTKGSGLGIGLAISRAIVEAHGGRLWYTPGPAGGAMFEFTLPRPPSQEDARLD